MSQQINLYNPALRFRREWLALSPLAIVVAVLLAVVLATGTVVRYQAAGLRGELQRQEDEAKRQQALLAQLGAKVADKQPEELLALRGQLAARQEVLTALDGLASVAGARFSDYLAGLARQSVSGLWLTGFAVHQGGSELEIRGRMSAPSLLPDYIRRLNAEKAFQGRQFAALDLSQGAIAATSGAAAPVSGMAAAAERPRFSEFKLMGSKSADLGRAPVTTAQKPPESQPAAGGAVR